MPPEMELNPKLVGVSSLTDNIHQYYRHLAVAAGCWRAAGRGYYAPRRQVAWRVVDAVLGCLDSDEKNHG